MAQATLILHGRGYMGKGRSIVVLHLLAICQESIIHWHQPKKDDSQQLSVQRKSHPIFVTIDALHCIFVLSLTFFRFEGLIQFMDSYGVRSCSPLRFLQCQLIVSL